MDYIKVGVKGNLSKKTPQCKGTLEQLNCTERHFIWDSLEAPECSIYGRDGLYSSKINLIETVGICESGACK